MGVVDVAAAAPNAGIDGAIPAVCGDGARKLVSVVVMNWNNMV